MGAPWQVATNGTVITLMRGWGSKGPATPMLRGTTPDDWTSVVEIEEATDAGLGMATLYVIAALTEDSDEWWEAVEYYEGDDEESDDESEQATTETREVAVHGPASDVADEQ